LTPANHVNTSISLHPNMNRGRIAYRLARLHWNNRSTSGLLAKCSGSNHSRVSSTNQAYCNAATKVYNWTNSWDADADAGTNGVYGRKERTTRGTVGTSSNQHGAFLQQHQPPTAFPTVQSYPSRSLQSDNPPSLSRRPKIPPVMPLQHNPDPLVQLR